MKKVMLLSVLFSLLAIMSVFGSIQGQEPATAVTEPVLSSGATGLPTIQIIIQFTGDTAQNSLLAADAGDFLPALSAAAGVELSY